MIPQPRAAAFSFAQFAFGIKCLRHSRAAFFNFAVSLGFMQTRDFQRQTARCGKPFYVAVRQIRRIQLRSQVSGKRFNKAAQSLRWQFFRADFHQKFYQSWMAHSFSSFG